MRLKKIILLALIGGLSGFVESLVAFLFSLILPTHTLFLDIFIGGVIFSIAGAGLVVPLIMSISELSGKRLYILTCGIIAGFFAGLFFNFGNGLYLGIVVYSIFLGFALKALQIPKFVWRISTGGIVGGFMGIIVSTLFLMAWLFAQKAYPSLENQLSIVSTILSTSLITYFMSFGMLFFCKGKY